ncbi:hypothetical protein [Singulisphaera sp. PoT]|uniref:hypothetical protein n=1 Tax=Singulisphaera sp. PoT TaxID=3411797 RepID=UPI003BF46ADE
MKTRKSRLGSLVRVLLVAGSSIAAFGCFAEDNEREFLKQTKAGIPSEIPNEKVSERRERLRSRSSIERKIEQRAKAKAEKAEKAKS